MQGRKYGGFCDGDDCVFSHWDQGGPSCGGTWVETQICEELDL